MISAPIELYTDGSSLKNPGKSGLGYIIRYYEEPNGNNEGMPEAKEIEGSQGFRLSTNNRMEIMAGIYGLKTIIGKVMDGSFQGASQVNLTSDSQYFVNAVNQNWIGKWQKNNWMTSGFQGSKIQPVKNKDLWEQFIAIQNQLRSLAINLTMTHIPGHAGYEFNERADKLAVAASNGNDHLIDEGFEKTAPLLNR